MRKIVCCLGVLALCSSVVLAQGVLSNKADTTPTAAELSILTAKPAAQPGNPQPVPPGSRQGGDTCANATTISTLPYTDTGTTSGYADDYDPPNDLDDCPYNPSAANDVVYQYTPTENMQIEIDLCDSGYDTKVFVYEAACTDPPARCDDDGCGSTYRSILTGVELTAGVTYYIVIDGYSGDAGTYDMTITRYIPPTGACCVDGECVATNTESECTALGGAWVAGEDCDAGFICPVIDCPGDSLFAQAPYSPDGAWTFGNSEADTGDGTSYLRYERIIGGVEGNVSDVHWWGAWLYNDGSWAECTESNPIFTITFYADDSGAPGAVTCGPYSVSVPGVGTGVLFASVYEMYYFEVPQLATPCGNFDWVSIQGGGSTTCWFMWLSSPDGDGYSLAETDGTPEADDIDLSLCLTGEYVPTYGACCHDIFETCEDNVEQMNCTGPNMRFVANTLCIDLDPPCGEMLGACCYEDGSCSMMMRRDCVRRLGDMNCDGFVTFDDITPYVTAVVSKEDYYAAYPECNYYNGDFDGTGDVNFDDINPFVDAVVAGGYGEETGTWLGPDTTCDDCCTIACPAGSHVEAEACGEDTNGGCNMDVPAFEATACDEVICGTVWALDNTRDTDWYEIDLGTTSQTITWTVEAEFPVGVGIITGNDCDNMTIADFQEAEACTPVSANATVTGVVWLFVGPTVYEGLPCTALYGRDYLGFVTCGEAPEGACCLPSGSCMITTGSNCANQFGAYYGDDTTCEDTEVCCITCDGDPEGEPVCYDEYDDVYNGGCNMAAGTETFLPLACDQTYCATNGMFAYGTTTYRDTDWYEVIVTEEMGPVYCTLSIDTGGLFYYGFAGFIEQTVPGVAGCDNNTGSLYGSYLSACASHAIAYYNPQDTDDICQPGTYYVWVGALSDNGNPPCGCQYSLTLNCEAADQGACCVYAAGTWYCYPGNTEADCTAVGGDYKGDGTECYGDPDNMICVPCDPADCPAGGIAEGEPTCGAGYDDTYNTGCNSDPGSYVNISCGNVICGETGVFEFDDETTYRDVDVFQFTIASQQTVRWEVTTPGYPVVLSIEDSGCPWGDTYGEVAATEGCGWVEVTLPAGTYWCLTTPAVFDLENIPCGTEWLGTLTCGAAARDAKVAKPQPRMFDVSPVLHKVSSDK